MKSQKYFIFVYDKEKDVWKKMGPVDGYDVALPNYPDVKAFVSKVTNNDGGFVGWAVYDYVTGAKLTNRLQATRQKAVEYANGYVGNFSQGSYQNARDYWIRKWGKANG